MTVDIANTSWSWPSAPAGLGTGGTFNSSQPNGASSITVAVTGTATASIDEDDIVAGGKTAILTLTDDTWVAAGATFDAQRLTLFDGQASDTSQANGWDAEIAILADATKEAAVVRTSDTIVTITWPAMATYDTTSPEIITQTVQAAALVLSGAALIGSPSITVAPVMGTTLLSEDFETGAIQYTSSAPYPVSGFFFTNESASVVPAYSTEAYPSASSVSSTAEAAGSIVGSTKSLRTFYETASYSRNTTIIEMPTGYDELFIRWYKKWGSNWVWPTDQQKFLKTGSSDGSWSQNFQIKRYVSPDFLTNYPPEDGVVIGADSHGFQIAHNYYASDNDDIEWMYQNRSTTHASRGSDSLNNGIGDPLVDGGDGNFLFGKEQWYCYEMQIKANTVTPSVLNDGINRIWIDGVLLFESTDLVIRKTTAGIDRLELEHVYQPFSGGDGGYSYIDNIDISDKYIGPA